MRDLKTLETEVLLDVLVKETARYTSKIAQKNNAELTHFEYEIALIQGELKSRKTQSENIFIKNKDPAIKLIPSAKSKTNNETQKRR